MSERFDYVIVGAGSAGCVLAARLSEDPDVTVALLEAGGEDTAPEIRIPAIFPIMFKTELDWDLFGDPEPGMDDRRLYLPRGRMLGGCSSINAMIYVRGNRLDYDGWAAAGCDGWGYDDVLPYFKRSEDNERGEDQFHGAGGPLTVAESRSMHPLVDAMIEAGRQAGHEYNPDFNGARQEGVGRFQLTQRDGRRLSTSDAFLHPVRERPNLTVITHAYATRLLFEGRRASGVEYVRLDEALRIDATREVILSAGTYYSPQLLMLSGIGPEEQLAPLGIEVREALPVGENLQDHCMCNLNYTTTGPSLFDAATPENFALFAAEGRGPLTSNIPEGAGFFRARSGVDAPDVEFHFAPAHALRRGADRPRGPGDGLRPGGDQAHQPRQGHAPLPDAAGQAPRRVQLPHHRGGPREHGGRPADGAGDGRAAGAARGHRPAVPGPGGRFGRGAAGLRAPRGHDGVPPHLVVRDGLGRRSGAAGVRL